ncbi:MAG: 2-oxoacid:acceptor oxidoreductase subunit alpha [Desulfobacteraceae bacterium]|nr:MAG: 2-oxoacid:acceptor oxidoreductase subunit alpha [Desulfobacteraceae bacterium]
MEKSFSRNFFSWGNSEMKDLNIVLAGAAGEGVQTIGEILAHVVAAQGQAVFSWQEFESRIRGGQNSYTLRIGAHPDNAPQQAADILLVLNRGALQKYKPLLKKDGILIAPAEEPNDSITIAIKKTDIEKAGGKFFTNMLAVGILTTLLGIKPEIVRERLAKQFGRKGAKAVAANDRAATEGSRLAYEKFPGTSPWNILAGKASYRLITGHEALSLGAAQAGCRFISAYPMSPSTTIIAYLTKEQERLGIFIEQAEDEISAVNMAIGASFAGVRAMTATSGGGFALMCESVSLAGMTETPLVIVLAQRPGPSTGLPTRTAQGDLLFAVHSGHGEFPKLVLAPSDAEDAFHATVRAFNLADKYQVPVIILTDQFLADASFSIEDFPVDSSVADFNPADPVSINEYKRYRWTASGISPRLYPGQSKHLVCADSDEHDEAGHITEDLAYTATAMVEKRTAKLRSLKKEMRPPKQTDLDEAEVVLIGWGSSRNAVREAMELLKQDGIKAGTIHFTELWPLPDFIFPEHKLYWTVESNSGGQIGRLLQSEYFLHLSGSIRRYDGLPLTGEYIWRNFYG